MPIKEKPTASQAELAVLTRVADLERAQRMEVVGLLAAGLTHELNNRLTAILLNAGNAFKLLGAGEPARANVENVLASARHALALARQLVSAGRAAKEEPGLLAINGVVHSALGLLRATLPPNIELEGEFAEGLSPVAIDAVELEQVLLNLVLNAAEAITGAGRIRVATLREAGGVGITVADTGCGMSEEVLARLFEPFFSTRADGCGTGLGLYMVREIVKRHGGTLEVASQPGEGSCFRISFPAPTQQPAEERILFAVTSPPAALRVLLVDDERRIRSALRVLFESEGYEVFEACDGRDALRVLATIGAVDLVLCDVMMPYMTGIELFESIAALDDAPAVILMSGYTPRALNHADALVRASAFINKPCSPEHILNVVRGVLDAKRRKS